MKKTIIISVLSILIISCGKNEDNTNIDSLITSKNLVSIKAKRAELQTQLTDRDEYIKDV